MVSTSAVHRNTHTHTHTHTLSLSLQDSTMYYFRLSLPKYSSCRLLFHTRERGDEEDLQNHPPVNAETHGGHYNRNFSLGDLLDACLVIFLIFLALLLVVAFAALMAAAVKDVWSGSSPSPKVCQASHPHMARLELC